MLARQKKLRKRHVGSKLEEPFIESICASPVCRFFLGLSAMLFCVSLASCTDSEKMDPSLVGKKDTGSGEGNGTDPNGTDPNGTDPSGDTGSEELTLEEKIQRCLTEVPPPSYCKMDPGPSCGDGTVHPDLGEECDDGNTLPGDGCTGVCKKEANYTCPAEGGPCTTNLVCGNGILDPGEVCDDHNTDDNDGCNATCTIQDPNYRCDVPGQPCELAVFCGDGRIKGTEQCEDGNQVNNDGCTADCMLEPGWRCTIPMQPCELVEVCGDGRVTSAIGEACDDGNVVGNDGCSADCRVIEDDWVCETAGEPCKYLAVCGNKIKNTNEGCDDGNLEPGDGCDAECNLEVGFICPTPGAPCITHCGDGIVARNEECDDMNLLNADGCSDTCQWEEGFACEGDPLAGTWTCHETKCGDGIKEGSEGCDDGNIAAGDECGPYCQLEPICNPAGGACDSTCGDGIVMASANEVCDDGNIANGDGCSSTCQLEQGFTCEQEELGDRLVIPLIVRDFNEDDPDFEFEADEEGDEAYGLVDPTLGLVRDTLDIEKKPVFKGTAGAGLITSAQTFANWYRDPADPKATVRAELVLYNDGDGNYINRFGANGQYWERLDIEYDGNPMFFPIDEKGITSESDYMVAKIPPFYFGIVDGEPTEEECQETGLSEGNCNPCWPPECSTGTEWMVDCMPDGSTVEDYECYPDSPKHNFHFTSQVVYWFQYDAANTYSLNFVGDDDLWVFLNGKLALDIGGIHTAQEDTLTIDATTASQYGLENGKVYEIIVFHAERQSYASTYKLTLSGFNASASVCTPFCGDAIVTPGEQCDLGTALNTGEYNGCNANCTLAPYCGDGIQNGPEICDDGKNVTTYGSGIEGCAPGCVAPAYCGDTIVQTSSGETCDDGINDGRYGGCTATCQNGPWCGDGVIEPGMEECDDGLNDGSYGNCAPGCVNGPHCGDGIVNGREDCDDGNDIDDDDCNNSCLADLCGDGVVQNGEDCDDGINDGGYGECAPGCVHGPRCGDGVVQGDQGEVCDDGLLEGHYGGCKAGCQLAAHCGDGEWQVGFEECEGDQVPSNDVICSPSCTAIEIGVI